MVAFVLAGALLEKLGGDDIEEMLPRLRGLRKPKLSDLPMREDPWRFDAEGGE
jgi:hypothetical protein